MKYFLGCGCLLLGLLIAAVGVIELSSGALLWRPGERWSWLLSLTGQQFYVLLSGFGFLLFGLAVIYGGIMILKLKEKA